jgi:hypothetical protein
MAAILRGFAGEWVAARPVDAAFTPSVYQAGREGQFGENSSAASCFAPSWIFRWVRMESWRGS